MQDKNNAPAIFQGVQSQFYNFIEANLVDEGCTCIVIKIVNHELLSIFLSNNDLEILFTEIQEIIKSTLAQTSHSIKNNKIVNYDRYLMFFIDKTTQASVNNFIYLIYYNIHLSISNIYKKIGVECKISNVNFERDGKNYKEIIQNLFCKLASNKSSNYFVESNNASIKTTLSSFNKLNLFKKSLNDNSFSFAFQPIVDKISGNIPYYECLLRIPNEKFEMVSAGPYIELAEKSGLNNLVDQIVLNMAVSELKAASQISLAVNISNSGIIDYNLLQIAKSLLSDKKIATRLIIEITETSLNYDYKKTKRFADTMRNLGCKIALDDFGSGFTSFKQLQNLHIDIIKIDGSFIRDVVYNHKDQHLVMSLIKIAKNLGAKTVAEFVENGEIAKFLLDVGVDYMQGNFFSPALNYRTWSKG